MTKEREHFGKELEELLAHFFRAFEGWVDDFEDFAVRRKEAAAISNRFLERHAIILINSYDELVAALVEGYEELAKEYRQISTTDKQHALLEQMSGFRTHATTLFRRINVKAELLLQDTANFPLKPELMTRLKELERVTYEDFIKKVKTSD